MDSSQLPQGLWERAVALVQEQGMPVNASSIQGAMNLLAAGGGVSGADDAESSVGNGVDKLMSRTDVGPAITPSRKQGPGGLSIPTYSGGQRSATEADKIRAMGNGGGQGPARLKTDDAADTPGGAVGPAPTSADTQPMAPGTQDTRRTGLNRGLDPTAAGNLNDEAIRNLIPGAREGDEGGGGSGQFGDGFDGGGFPSTEAGILAAIAATLTKRKNAPSLGQASALGNYMTKPAINQYEGVMTPSTDAEMKKTQDMKKSGVRSGRSGGKAGGGSNRLQMKRRGAIDQSIEDLSS